MGIFQFKKKKKEEAGNEKKEKLAEISGKDNEGNKELGLKTADKNEASKPANSKKDEKKGGKSEGNLPPREKLSEIASRVLIGPWITERSHSLMALNKYVFKVAKSSSKIQIGEAIKELYGAKVIKVNIINIPPKKRNFAGKAGWKSGYKKAVVTLKEGDKIELLNR